MHGPTFAGTQRRTRPWGPLRRGRRPALKNGLAWYGSAGDGAARDGTIGPSDGNSGLHRRCCRANWRLINRTRSGLGNNHARRWSLRSGRGCRRNWRRGYRCGTTGSWLRCNHSLNWRWRRRCRSRRRHRTWRRNPGRRYDRSRSDACRGHRRRWWNRLGDSWGDGCWPAHGCGRSACRLFYRCGSRRQSDRAGRLHNGSCYFLFLRDCL